MLDTLNQRDHLYQSLWIWCRGFIEDNPTGSMARGKMVDMYSSVLQPERAELFVNQMFEKFDMDNSGGIDFKVSDAIRANTEHINKVHFGKWFMEW